MLIRKEGGGEREREIHDHKKPMSESIKHACFQLDLATATPHVTHSAYMYIYI